MEGTGRDFENAPEPFVESIGGIGVSGGEARQGIALRRETALAGLERRFRRELIADVVEDGENRQFPLPFDET